MSRWWRIFGALVFAMGFGTLGTGCPRTTTAGFEKGTWGRRLLERRASFELQCPAAQLRYVPLGPGLAPYLVVGVEGCGRRWVYRYQDGVWVPDIGIRRPAGE